MSGLRVLAVEEALGGAAALALGSGGSGGAGTGRKRRRGDAGARATGCAGPDRLMRFLYVKEHNARGSGSGRAGAEDSDEEGGDGGRTLFVANAAAAWSEDDARKLFSRFGEVDAVHFGRVSGCRIARVEFADAKAVKKALSTAVAAGPFDLAARQPAPIEGPRRGAKAARRPAWLEQYEADRPGNDKLKEESDAYLEEFARLEAEEEARRKALEASADADGFTTVSYKRSARTQAAAPLSADTVTTAAGGTRHVATITGATRNALANKKKKTKELADFYRFQKREQKRDELADLRAKFEQDKEHVQRLKNARKFKPF